MIQRSSGIQRTAILVGCQGAARHLPTAFAKWGVEVLRIPGDTPRTAELTARLAARSPLCVLAGQESCGPLADALAERLGLPGNSPELSTTRRDTYTMGAALRRAGVRSAEQWRGSDAQELADRAEARGVFPVVVKQPSGTGAGVTVCHEPLEVRKAAEAVLSTGNSRGDNAQALVQEFLSGPEFSVDTVSRDGRHCTVSILRHHTRLRGPSIVHEYAELVDPATTVAADLRAYTADVLGALGIRHGPTHTAVILTPHGPTLVDAGVRLGHSVLPGYDDLSRGTNQVDLTVLAHTAPEEFHTRWAGGSYDKLCEAHVVHTAAGCATLPDELDQTVVDAVAALPSVYFFDAGRRADPRVRPHLGRRPASGAAFALHASPRQLEQDRLQIRQLTAAVTRPRLAAEAVCSG